MYHTSRIGTRSKHTENHNTSHPLSINSHGIANNNRTALTRRSSPQHRCLSNNDSAPLSSPFIKLSIGVSISHNSPSHTQLSPFLQEWKNITTDTWVLNIIQHGYRIEFCCIPPSNSIKPTSFSAALHLEISSLLSKGAIIQI